MGVYAGLGAAWGLLMFVVMTMWDGASWSVWRLAYWLVIGVLAFGGAMYWLARSKWRSQQPATGV